jgi:hypothetical protein
VKDVKDVKDVAVLVVTLRSLVELRHGNPKVMVVMDHILYILLHTNTYIHTNTY